jgi:hypothetical protein
MSLWSHDIIVECSRVGHLALESKNILLEGPRFSKVWPESDNESHIPFG